MKTLGKMPRIVGSFLGVVALSQPVTAMAQACLPQQDLADGIVYAMPLLTEAAQTKCAKTLSGDGFLATNGESFAGRYVDLQQDAWPGAFRLLMQFSGDDFDGTAELIEALPEEALRPFIDAIIVQKVGEEIKPKDCANIERAMELLAPLPPQNTAELVSFIVSLTDVKNPEICKLEDR